MLKKIAIVGTVGLPANYGGFETLTEYMTKALNTEFDFTVYCSSKSYDITLESHNNCRLKYINIEANGMQSILYDIVSIYDALKYADVILILGVSGCISLPFVRLFSKKKIIVNIDGLEWKRQKWGKAAKWFLKFSERLAVKYANHVVADNKVIQNHVSTSYGKPSHLIAYGGDHTTRETLSATSLKQYPFLKHPYAFKVCRIEPENNIEMILQAFSKTKQLPLVLVGNWNKSDFGRQMKRNYDGISHIHLLDPIYNQKLLNELRSNCYMYVHGHSAGGTNPSLVEAMSLGLPVVAYGVQYNSETTCNQAFYFQSSDELSDLMSSILKSDLVTNAATMKTIADKLYTWIGVAEKYKALF